MDFCPNCGMRLISIPKKKRNKVVLQLACPKCHYKEKIEHTPPVIPKVVERAPPHSGDRKKRTKTANFAHS